MTGSERELWAEQEALRETLSRVARLYGSHFTDRDRVMVGRALGHLPPPSDEVLRTMLGIRSEGES